jgi:hypothetical protein
MRESISSQILPPWTAPKSDGRLACPPLRHSLSTRRAHPLTVGQEGRVEMTGGAGDTGPSPADAWDVEYYI